ncbi:hypothetical protein [Psychrobacter sp. I-STPA6b]|uniref:hypothetical protein n=1 Tax=Psychrobacter sp. I-STPA6b TaxID=2585718 RepID=UPI001D0C5042|nr:hypothetical protein [Psychrobacter sp. I-STPA6b]
MRDKAMSDFKTSFNGFMKIYLHDDVPERLASRAIFTEDWLANQKRRQIMKRERKFKISLYIYDTDGDKRGHEVMVFKSKGGQKDLTKAIFEFGNKFVDELLESLDDFVPDLVNSYAVVRV